MATVVERQEQAQKLEEQGDPIGALAIYDDLLGQFEQDPTFLVGPPDLYVKVGDLRARLGQSQRAFAAYHQAAEHFALRGSADHVSQLCFRMTHLSPAAADVYGRYARRLNDYGYAASALGILKEYASTAGLAAVADAVEAAQAQARSGSAPQIKELLDNFENALAGSHTQLKPKPDEDVPSASSLAMQEKEVSIRPTKTRAERFGWRYVLGAATLVGAGLATIVLAIGEGGQVESTPTYTLAAVNPRLPAPVAELNAVATDSVLTPVSQTQVASAERDVSSVGSPPATDATVRVITEPIVVGSLDVHRMSEVEYRGLRGFRVVHLLESGSEYVVESYPVDDNTAGRYPVGTVIVTVIPPDTTVSIVRVDERHLVFASGVVPQDSARVLTCMLRVREPVVAVAADETTAASAREPSKHPSRQPMRP